MQTTTRIRSCSWISLPLIALLLGCGAEEASQPAIPDRAPVSAPVATVEAQITDVSLRAVGSVEPLAQATPATRVSGRITKIAADRGDHVEEGQLLIRIDQRDLQQALERARAQRAQAAAASQLAEADFDRATALFAEDAIAQQALDRARTNRDAARAALDATERAIGEARAALTYGDVRAPFAGVVTDRRVEVGDLTAPGQPLITVERSDSVRIVVIVAESSVSGITIGDEASMEAAGRQWSGRVESIVPASSRQSHSYEVRVLVDNEQGVLRSGQFARATFKIGEREALLIDADLIVSQGQLRGAYVMTKGRALLRWLRVGAADGDRVEVLSGLRAGETLVHPVAGLRDGVAVTAAAGA